MRVPGITCENTRRIVHAALDVPGWVFDGILKSGHGQLRWTPTEETVVFGLTPSDRNSWKNTAKDIERVCGVKVWRRGNHRPSRRRAVVQVESNRVRRDRERFERAAVEKAEARRRDLAEQTRRDATARRITEADERRRSILRLMMPGH